MAGEPRTERALRVGPGDVCKCGLAKSYHDGRLASPEEYVPRIDAASWREGYEAALRAAPEPPREWERPPPTWAAIQTTLTDNMLRAYATGHRDGVECGQETAGFGGHECDHVGAWRLAHPSGAAIEAEAATPSTPGLDVERLARAYSRVVFGVDQSGGASALVAQQIAAEYAAQQDREKR